LQTPSLSIGGAADHIHILCRLSKKIDVATLIRELKRDSSKWIKHHEPKMNGFYWQNAIVRFDSKE
jgi:REP element-mobilizing transposase RayT